MPRKSYQTALGTTLPVHLSIYLGGATCPTAVGVQFLHCTNVAETEKAVQVKADNGKTCWFPKRALVVEPLSNAELLPARHREFLEKNPSYRFAGWFRPDGYQAWFIDAHSSVGVLTCK